MSFSQRESDTITQTGFGMVLDLLWPVPLQELLKSCDNSFRDVSMSLEGLLVDSYFEHGRLS